MFISKEEIGSTDLLFLSLSEMPPEPRELLSLGDGCACTVLLLPHLLCDGELRLLASDASQRYLPEALLLGARHLLWRRGLPLDELVFLAKGEQYRISAFQNIISLNYKISKQEFTKQRISLSDCTADLYVFKTQDASYAVFLCDDVCPLDTELLWRLFSAQIGELSFLLSASVSDGVLHLVRTKGEGGEAISICDALLALSLWHRLGRRLPELSVASLDGISIALRGACEARIRYRLTD